MQGNNPNGAQSASSAADGSGKFQGALHRMNSKIALVAALVAGLLPVAAVAQSAPAAAQPAAPAASAPASPDAVAAPAQAAAQQAPTLIPPSAFPARIALISFQKAVAYTNEGQRAMADLKKKYQPQSDKLDDLAKEIDSLKKALQAAPATLSDEDRASRLKTIDTKEKLYQSEGEDFQSESQNDVQAALSKISQKFYAVLAKYVNDNGYTIVFDVSSEQTPVLWATQQPNADITVAVIEAYNAESKVAPPEAGATAAHPKPTGTATPHTTTAKPAGK
jgi:outer membrane protein